MLGKITDTTEAKLINLLNYHGIEEIGESELYTDLLKLIAEAKRELLESMPIKVIDSFSQVINDSQGTCMPTEIDIAEEEGFNMAMKKLIDWRDSKLKELK